MEQEQALPTQAVLLQTKEARFEHAMETHLLKVYRLCYWLVKDKTAAEDICQDVFLKAYKHLDSFRGDSKLETWLYRIAVNEAKRYVRSWTFRHLLYFAQPKSGESTDIESQVIKKDGEAKVGKHVDALPFKYRQVIILHYYEELEAEDIASILGITQGAVYTRLHRARQRLKTFMQKEGD